MPTPGLGEHACRPRSSTRRLARAGERSSTRLSRALFGVALMAAGASTPVMGQPSASPEVVPGEMLVGFRATAVESQRQMFLDRYGYRPARRLRSLRRPASVLDRLYRVALPAGIDLETALEEARRDPLVELAQPNYIYHALSPPDDPYFYLQWAHENTGDNAPHTDYGLHGPDPRLAGADVHAVAAFDWISSMGLDLEPVIVGIIDSGIDLQQPGRGQTGLGSLPHRSRQDRARFLRLRRGGFRSGVRAAVRRRVRIR